MHYKWNKFGKFTTTGNLKRQYAEDYGLIMCLLKLGCSLEATKVKNEDDDVTFKCHA